MLVIKFPIFICFITSSSCAPSTQLFTFFFFNDTATTETYPLPLHDALPISRSRSPNRTSSRSPRPRRRNESAMNDTPEAVTNERRDAPSQPERAPRAARESHGARGPCGDREIGRAHV